MKLLIRRIAFLIAASPTLALHAQADPVPVATSEPSNFTVSAGGFLLSSISTRLSLAASNGNAGTDIDFNKSLGESDSASVFRVDGEWRFAARHKLEFSWFGFDQSSTKVISTSINWGDQVFPVNATLRSSVNTDVYKVNYGYTFYREGDSELSALIGLHITRYETSLGINGGGASQAFAVTAPLPVLGLEWNSRISESLTSRVAFEYFGVSLEGDKYSGHLTDFVAALNYRLNEHWSVGGGYNRFDFTAKLKDRVELKARRSYNGLLVFLSANL